MVTLVTFTQPHRECLRFFYHDECGLWCPGYGHVTDNTYDIEKITPHPSYKGYGIKFALAFAYTKSKITFSYRTMPISLPKIPNDDPYRYANEELKFSGWGYFDDLEIGSDDLREATFKVLPESECFSKDLYFGWRKSKDLFFCSGNAVSYL